MLFAITTVEGMISFTIQFYYATIMLFLLNTKSVRAPERRHLDGNYHGYVNNDDDDDENGDNGNSGNDEDDIRVV